MAEEPEHCNPGYAATTRLEPPESGIKEAAFGFGDRTPQSARGLDPFAYDDFRVGQSFLPGRSVGRTLCENLGTDECVPRRALALAKHPVGAPPRGHIRQSPGFHPDT